MKTMACAEESFPRLQTEGALSFRESIGEDLGKTDSEGKICPWRKQWESGHRKRVGM